MRADGWPDPEVSMTNSPKDDFLEAEIESSLAPLRAMGFSPAVVAEAEKVLRFALTSHPTGRYLMKRARPRVVDESGPTPAEEVDAFGRQSAAKGRGSR
jgi:hypothetical protein